MEKLIQILPEFKPSDYEWHAVGDSITIRDYIYISFLSFPVRKEFKIKSIREDGVVELIRDSYLGCTKTTVALGNLRLI